MTGLLSDSQIKSMRDVHETNLPQTCTIRRMTISTDSQGGQTESWANTYTSVPCRLAQRRSRQREELLPDRWTEYSEWVLYVAYDQDITMRDRVVVGSDTFEVTFVDVEKGYNLVRAAQLERIE